LGCFSFCGSLSSISIESDFKLKRIETKRNETNPKHFQFFIEIDCYSADHWDLRFRLFCLLSITFIDFN
jgi:hypothetical protein